MCLLFQRLFTTKQNKKMLIKYNIFIYVTGKVGNRALLCYDRALRTMPEHFGQYKNDHIAATRFLTFKFFTPKPRFACAQRNQSFYLITDNSFAHNDTFTHMYIIIIFIVTD